MTSKKLFLLLVLGFSFVASSAQAAPTPWNDFDGGFETGDFSQYLEVQAAPGRATLVTSPAAEGTYAARFERQVGDELVAGSSRSEAVPNREFHAGETLYFRHLLYLPYESIDWKHFLILCQWHDSSGNPPPLTLQAVEIDGVKKLIIGSGSQKQLYYEFPIPGSSQWFELVYRITFGVKGSIEVWLNGQSLGEVEGVDTLGTEPTNWKVGAYRDKEAEGTMVAYQDGVMITKRFFSNPPVQATVTKPVTTSPASSTVAGPPAPLASSNTQACKLAKDGLLKAQTQLKSAHRHLSTSKSQGQRRAWAKRVSRSAKHYRQAKQRVRRTCQGTT